MLREGLRWCLKRARVSNLIGRSRSWGKVATLAIEALDRMSRKRRKRVRRGPSGRSEVGGSRSGVDESGQTGTVEVLNLLLRYIHFGS